MDEENFPDSPTPKSADKTNGERMPAKRKQSGPMDEENFPDSPTRRSADEKMSEPRNIPSSADPIPRKRAPVVEDDSED